MGNILPVAPNGCMGHGCIQKAVFRLYCPHSTFTCCSACLPLNYKPKKCGCADEDISAIIPMEVPNDNAQQSTQDTSQESNPNSLDQLKWIDDGVSEIGWIEDGAGNKFAWNKRVRADGAVGYRCIYQKPSQKRCTAVARRFFFDRSTRDRERAIILETPHVHLDEP